MKALAWLAAVMMAAGGLAFGAPVETVPTIEPGEAAWRAAREKYQAGKVDEALIDLDRAAKNAEFPAKHRHTAALLRLNHLMKLDKAAGLKALADADALGLPEFNLRTLRAQVHATALDYDLLTKSAADLEAYSVSSAAYFGMLAAKGKGDNRGAWECAKRGLLAGDSTGPGISRPLWLEFARGQAYVLSEDKGIDKLRDMVQRIILTIPDGAAWAELKAAVRSKLQDFKD